MTREESNDRYHDEGLWRKQNDLLLAQLHDNRQLAENFIPSKETVGLHRAFKTLILINDHHSG